MYRPSASDATLLLGEDREALVRLRQTSAARRRAFVLSLLFLATFRSD
jgi:hypothetical protein